MTVGTLSQDAGIASTRAPATAINTPSKLKSAAQEFEGLLLTQMLHSVRESAGNGLFSDGGDEAGGIATDFAEQQMAVALAQQGGLGIGALIEGTIDLKKSHAVPGNRPPGS